MTSSLYYGQQAFWSNTQDEAFTDRDMCYWLDGFIDKTHTHWEDVRKGRTEVRTISDGDGATIMGKIDTARRNRGNITKHALFVEWLAGVLEMWGHLDEAQRGVANDSINRELSKVFREAKPGHDQFDTTGPFHLGRVEPITFITS